MFQEEQDEANLFSCLQAVERILASDRPTVLPSSLCIFRRQKAKQAAKRKECEVLSAARHSPLGRLDARSGCETQFMTKPGQNHSICW